MSSVYDRMRKSGIHINNPEDMDSDVGYTEIMADGSIRYLGNATMWKDMVADLLGKKLTANPGTVDYDFTENAIKFQTGGDISEVNDRIGGNLEINHEFKVGRVTFKPHLHWFQAVASSAVIPFVWTAEYRLQRNGQAKTTTWTQITATAGTDDIWDFTGEADGTYNQITRFDDISVFCGISDTIQFRLARTDSEVGDALVYFFDMHGEVDSAGSRQEIVK